MADVNANIGINIDSSNALSQLKALQRQISQFHTSIARSSEAAALAQRGLQKNLLSSINSIGAFSAEMRTVRTSAESFTNSLEKNKFSMREYFRYAGGATKTFGRAFKTEFDTIGKVAEERVKTLQTQYIKMGRNASGAMEAIAIRPTSLNMQDYGTKTAIAAQKQALFNQLMKQGSTNLLNFGKNTQWSGRQLMVGFTLPLIAVGSAAAKAFMDMEVQALRFRKVYGDLFTPQAETQQVLDDITELAKQFTKYGVAVSTTVGLAAEAAAAGFQGLDLQRQTTQATRLAILGQVDTQKALETTISLQNAFGMSSDKLADSINFLNAVENQTVVSLDDITTAIPKVAPVIQQLGGDVKDLTFFIAAMKEGGINASEGANALKSGLAALINPTKKASAMLASFGINATAIVDKNKGDLKATVIEFATALNQLDPLARARSIEQMFGKFQFARLSTLFANVAKDGNQASRVLDLANASVEELSALSEKELGMTAESSMNKFKKATEDLKIALVPVGQAFLEALTPIVEFVGGILEKFANLSSGTKKLITLLTVGIGAVGPVLLMTFGLLANGVANIIKLFLTLRGGYQRLTGQTSILGEQTQYMTMEQLDAAAAAHSLNQTHARLTQTFTAERVEIARLISAYNSAAGAARNFATNNPGAMLPRRAVRKLASGIVSVPGPKGAGDVVPAMLSPGEAVIPAKFVKKYGPLIDGMVSGNIPGYVKGRSLGTGVDVPGGMDVSHFGPGSSRTGAELLVMVEGLQTSAARNIRKMVASFDNGLNRVFTTFDNQVIAQFTEINRLMQTQGKASTQKVKQNLVGTGFAETRDIELQRQLVSAGMSIDEFKVVNKKITDEIIVGFDALGDKTEITSEELNNLLRKAYQEVAKTDARVEKAHNNMKQVSTAFSPDRDGVRGGRIPITDESYVKQKKSTQRTPSQFRKMQSQMVGAENIPYPQSSRFVVTHNMAKELELSSKQAAAIYDKMSVNAKVSLSKMRGDLTAFKKEFIIEAAKVGEMVGTSAVNATAKAAGTASPSRKTRRTGEDIGRGLEEGMKSRQDDVALVGSQLGQAATGGVKGGATNIPFRAPGQPGFVAANAPRAGVSMSVLNAAYEENDMKNLMQKQQQRIAVTNQRMNSLNKAFMSGTFALSALSGVASMSSGNLGKFSQILFTITGPLFALSSILQLFTGQKIVTLLSGLSKLKLGVIAVGITALAVGFKLVNDAKKKELEHINGLSNAMKTTTAQVKTLGDFFGVIPTKLPFDGRNRELVRKDVRSERDKLRADEGFQKEYASTIKTLSKSTAEQAALAFTSLALNLKAQGFASEQVQVLIDALREEAGKTSVKLDVKSLNFSPESIKMLQDQIAKLLVKFNTDFEIKPTGGQKFLSGFIGSLLGETPKIMEMTKDTKKSLSELSTFVSETSKSSAGMFRLGLISGKEFEASLSGIIGTMDGLDEAARRVALIEIFKQLDVNAAPFLKNIQTAKQEMMLIALLSSGVFAKDSPTLKALGSTDSAAQGRALNTIRKAYEDLFGAVTKVNKENEKLGGNGIVGAGELNALQEKTKAIKQQTDSFILLRNAKIDEKTATELSNDAEIAALILKNKSSKLLPKIIAQVKEYQDALKKQGDAALKYADPSTTFKNELGRLQAVAKLREKLIDIDFAPRIKKENDALKVQEDKLKNINTQIEGIREKQIKPIQNIIDSNSFVLQGISLQEDAINEKYEKEISALDKIEKINQNISNVQKQRLSIADALTRGDISAAAQLMQEARSEQAQSAVAGQRDILTTVRDQKIAALGRVEIEKQNKTLQYEISVIEKEQLSTLESQKITIENTITSTQANITALNSQVTVAKEGAFYAGKTKESIDDLAELIGAAEAAGIEFDKVLLSQATNAERLAAALLKSSGYTTGLGSSAVSGAGTVAPVAPVAPVAGTKTGSTVTVKSGNTLSGIAKAAGVSLSDVIKANPQITNPSLIRPGQVIKIPGKMYGGQVMPQGKGGMGITKSMKFGGTVVGSDSVPTMLTPGEFVMNKAASRAYGPLLERINESKYPSMLNRGQMSQVPVSNTSTSMNDNSSAVYTYNLGFNISNNNSNVNDIARAVIAQIKNVDSQRLRGQRQ